LLLDAYRHKLEEADQKYVGINGQPIYLFLKIQPYHVTTEERVEWFELTKSNNIFSMRDPVRTVESILSGMLRITCGRLPELDISTFYDTSADCSFLDSPVQDGLPDTAFGRLVTRIHKTRDFSALDETFLHYFSYYPVLNDPELKECIWKDYCRALPQAQLRAELVSLGYDSLDTLIGNYKSVPADQFNKLPELLFKPLKFRRTGWASMQELLPLIREKSFVVIDGTDLLMQPEHILSYIQNRLNLPGRVINPALSYDVFDPGFKGQKARPIYNALFQKVDQESHVLPPRAIMPLKPSQLPRWILPEIETYYQTYISYLQLPQRARLTDVTTLDLFNLPLEEQKTLGEFYPTSFYARIAVDSEPPQRDAILTKIRDQNPDYALFFNMIDRAFAKSELQITNLATKMLLAH
jgi:hypothetical protein